MTTRMIRNLGIVAHVDAGKTTLTERILFYTGRIHAMGEVKGARPATTDHDAQEQRRGITIGAAAVTCPWDGAILNLVDTPGHLDFTVEVERAMIALDGAVLVLDAVAGVQAQTRTVERQMARYGVPRIAFVNKCDRAGADPLAVVAQLRDRLGVEAVAVQLPVGLGEAHRGVVDLLRGEVITFEGAHGAEVRRAPADPDEVAEAREQLVDRLSMHDDSLTEALMAGAEPTADRLSDALRRAVAARTVVPVLLGAAYRNVGVQPLLDAVVAWLPPPGGDPEGPALARAFKVVETDHGPVTWLRVVRGRIAPGDRLVDGGDGSRHRLRRLVQLQADQTLPVDGAVAGDVVAALGLSVPTGATLCDPAHPEVLGAMQVPRPMVERRLRLLSGAQDKLSRVLGRMVREDPSLRVHTDPETGELRLTGMGELHLDVIATRLRDDHGLDVALGPPGVRGRLALGRPVAFDQLLSKQTGGPGMYARIVGTVEPAEDFVFAWEVQGGAIESAFRSAVAAGFRDALEHEADVPVVGARVVVTDGAMHPKDSSDAAFHLCARLAFRDVLARAEPVALQPVARVEVEAPPDRHGVVLSSLMARRGRVVQAEVGTVAVRIEAEVPLSEMFGYADTLRSLTSGTGAYAMEFSHFAPA